MTIETSKNKRFNAEWFGSTLDHKFVTGEIFVPIGTMFLSDIIDEFEGLDCIDRYDESEGNAHFPIDPHLRSISWTDRGTILLEFWGKQE